MLHQMIRPALVCAIAVTIPAPVLAAITITQPYEGITRINRTETLPRPTNINVVQIDLTSPGISFKLSPPNPPTPNTFGSETRGQTTLNYLTQEQAQLAVNVHFFDFPLQANGGTNLTGIAASQGTVYSAFDPAPVLNYALLPNATGLNISATNQAQFVERGATGTSLVANGVPVVPYNTLSGSAQIITNGVKSLPPNLPPRPNSTISFYTDQIAARTAIGLSQNNQTLVIFTVDATNGSQGLTISEMADFLIREYGVYNALNLDGGGSTTLALMDPVTNVPSVVNFASGGPRAVGSSLAVFAVPEPGSLVFISGTLLVVLRHRGKAGMIFVRRLQKARP